MKRTSIVLVSATAFAFSTLAAKAEDKTAPFAQATPNIVETAIAAKSVNTFVEAIKAAGLVDLLRERGPFTVFAPSDDAFAKLPASKLQELLIPENQGQLMQILNHHIVPGAWKSHDFTGRKWPAKTAADTNVWIDATDGYNFGNANVLKVDIEASNGVIHVIDTVLMPEHELES
jgi:uncharacterized surface protein with fasciclin (FAS1) repeats